MKPPERPIPSQTNNWGVELLKKAGRGVSAFALQPKLTVPKKRIEKGRSWGERICSPTEAYHVFHPVATAPADTCAVHPTVRILARAPGRPIKDVFPLHFQ